MGISFEQGMNEFEENIPATNKLKPTIVAVDVDGVLSNFTKGFLDIYNRVHDTQYTEDDLHDYKMSIVRNTDDPEEFNRICKTEKFCENLPLLNDAQLFREFYHKYDVVIITAVSDQHIPERIAWFKKHFPDFPEEYIHFKQDKFDQSVPFDYIIEDNPALFSHKNVIAYAHPYNKKEIDACKPITVGSWTAIKSVAAKILVPNVRKEKAIACSVPIMDDIDYGLTKVTNEKLFFAQHDSFRWNRSHLHRSIIIDFHRGTAEFAASDDKDESVASFVANCKEEYAVSKILSTIGED